MVHHEIRGLEGAAQARVGRDAPDRVDPPLPLMQYGDVRRFPLWGVAGKGIELNKPNEDGE